MKTILCLLTLVAMTTVALCTAPMCCELSEECLQQYREGRGGYLMGAKLSKTDRQICNKEGRGHYCVAEWDDGNWYCASPGSFLFNRARYAPQCPGKLFPIKGPKKPCFGIAEGAAQCKKVEKKLQKCEKKLGKGKKGK